MTLLAALHARLAEVADPARAPAMQRYAKSAMPFLGVPAPQRRAVSRAVFAELRWPDSAAWRTDVRAIWSGAAYREERHCALDLAGVRAARPFQTMDALPLYEMLIVEGAWWDYVDEIATHRLPALLEAEPKAMKIAMLGWARGANLWTRRSAILCQLGAKAETDRHFLQACIMPSLDSREFFLRKAIGWALRQYARTDPDWVRAYVAEHEDRLSALSKREALKHIGMND